MSLIRNFWTAMNGNDWAAVADHFLADDFIGLMPQTGEVIQGHAEFIRLNAGFPGQKGWLFEVMAAVTEGDRAASDVRVTNPTLDPDLVARVLTIHDLTGDRIARQTEFWPERYPIPDWRQGLLTTDPDRARF